MYTTSARWLISSPTSSFSTGSCIFVGPLHFIDRCIRLFARIEFSIQR